MFWKTVKPVFTDKVQVSQSITLIENGEMVTNDLKIAEISTTILLISRKI